MGQELINKIIEQTQFKLRSWNRDSTGVFLFSQKTEDAINRFSECVSKLFAEKSGLFIAPLSQTGFEVIIEDIKYKKKQLEISPTAKIMVRIVVSGDEEPDIAIPSTYEKQIVRLVSNAEQAHDDESFYIFDNTTGLEAMLLLTYMQSLTSENQVLFRGVAVESVCDNSVRINWVQALRKILDNCLSASCVPPEELNLMSKDVDTKLNDRLEIFLKQIEPFPDMDAFPLDDQGIMELLDPVSSTRGKGLIRFNIGRNTVTRQFKLQNSLKKLYGETQDGQLRVRDYYIELLSSQKIEEIFYLSWAPLNSWYYQMPLQWLTENLETHIIRKLSVAEDLLYKLQDEALQERTLSVMPEVDKLCTELGEAYGFAKIYRAYAEFWYWKKALMDVQSGSFSSQARDAKKRIEEQFTVLSNFKNGNYMRSEVSGRVNWDKDITPIISEFKPEATPWTIDSVKDFFKFNCNWTCFTHKGLGGIIYCMLKCNDAVIRAEIEKLEARADVGGFTTRWFFSDDILNHGIIVIAIVPRTFIGDLA